MTQPKCSACNGANLVTGKPWFHVGFTPENKFMLAGLSMVPHACLDCGCVTPFLDPDDFQALKNKQKK